VPGSLRFNMPSCLDQSHGEDFLYKVLSGVGVKGVSPHFNETETILFYPPIITCQYEFPIQTSERGPAHP
jgi:hypothetical protein